MDCEDLRGVLGVCVMCDGVYGVMCVCVCVCVFFCFFKQKTAYEIQYGLVGSEMCIRDRANSEEGTEISNCYIGNGIIPQDGLTYRYEKTNMEIISSTTIQNTKNTAPGFTNQQIIEVRVLVLSLIHI